MRIDYINKSIRESTILTGTYIAGTILGAEASHPTKCEEYTQMVVNINFTKGSLTNALVKIEFSPDGTTYNQETFSSVSGASSADTLGYHTLIASGNYNIPIQITTRFIKISILGTGDVSGSSCNINVDLGVN